jgi:hypothetical protein
MFKRILFLPFFILTIYSLSAQNTGAINGFVRDIRTLLPLEGVTIKVLGSDLSVQTDKNGFYRLSNIPLKSWNIEATAIGYKPERKFDVIITTGNIPELNFELEPAYKELKSVEVKAQFIKPVGVVNSVQNLGVTEIAKYPGANFDIAKVVQSYLAYPALLGSEMILF